MRPSREPWHSTPLSCLPVFSNLIAARTFSPILQANTLPTEFLSRFIPCRLFALSLCVPCLSVLRLTLEPYSSHSWSLFGFSRSPDNLSCLQKEPRGGHGHPCEAGGEGCAHSHISAFLSLSLKEREENGIF